jgi:hypothetical protein
LETYRRSVIYQVPFRNIVANYVPFLYFLIDTKAIIPAIATPIPIITGMLNSGTMVRSFRKWSNSIEKYVRYLVCSVA